MRLIVPFGFYGWGNIGDESTLQGFARLVRWREPSATVWVASRNTEHTSRVEPTFRYFQADRYSLRMRWARLRATAAVFAGGTPIMDGLGAWPLNEVAPLVVSAREGGLPVAFVGVGTEGLRSPESVDIVARELAPRVDHWTVRSQHDRDRLVSAGVPCDLVTVAADLAWLLPPVTPDFGRDLLQRLGVSASEWIFGVNVNNERIILESDPQFFAKIAALADHVVETFGARVLFFCSEVREGPSFDKAASGQVLAKMRHADRATQLPNRYWTPQELLSVISCCRTVVSTRYHVCLFSALQQVPFIALQRSDKVRDLCTDIGWRYGVPLGQITADALVELVDGIDRSRSELASSLRQTLDRQVQASRTNHEALDSLSASVRSRSLQ